MPIIHQHHFAFIFALGAGIVTGMGGCATSGDRSSSLKPDFTPIQSAVHERTGGASVHIIRPDDQKARQTIDAHVAAMLASGQPLSADEAVQIAFFENRSLQAQYARLGVAQAELVQTGLLENPTLSADAGFPSTAPSATAIDLGLTGNLLRMLLMPRRKDIAQTELGQTQLEVTHGVLETAADVRRSYYELVAAQQLAGVEKVLAQTQEAGYQFAQQLFKAGNISDLDLARTQAVFEQTRAAYGRALMDVRDKRAHLNVLMGLWKADEVNTWSVPDTLPDLPEHESDLTRLESLAIAQRLDLQSAGKEVDAMAKVLGITEDWRLFLKAEVGVVADRDTDKQWVVGPEVSVQLPIFDQSQATISQLQYQLDAARDNLANLAINIRSDVRRLRDRLVSLRQEVAHYQSVMVPLNEKIMSLSMKYYNFMLLDTFQLLSDKREALATYHDAIDAQRDYWITRADLEEAVGGRLKMMAGGSSAPPSPSPPSSSSDEHSTHHQHH